MHIFGRPCPLDKAGSVVEESEMVLSACLRTKKSVCACALADIVDGFQPIKTLTLHWSMYEP